LGDKHIEVSRRACELADLFYHTGRFSDAEPLIRQALAIAEVDPECGPEHEETAKLVNNLASVLLKQKKLQEAHPVQERAVAIATAIFGRAHPNTETTRANLVELLEEMDDRIGAVKLLTAAVRDELMAPVEPPQQQRLAGAYRALATMQLKQGEEKAAEESLLSAHEAYKGTLGEAHPATGSTLAAIAHLMRKQGRWQEALPLYESLATVTEDALGPSHPQVGIALRTLAQVRSALGKHAQAVADAEKAATIMRKMHGGVHKAMADTLDTLAACVEAGGDAAKAAALREEAAGVRSKEAEMKETVAKGVDPKTMQATVQKSLQARMVEKGHRVETLQEAPQLSATQERLRKKLAEKAAK